MVRKEFLEELIIKTVIDELSKPQTIDKIVKELLKIQDRQITDNPELKLLTREKSRVSKSLENLMYAIENGIISNTTNKRLHELEEQQEDLERKILIEKSRTAVKVPESIMREYYRQALELEPQMLINYLIKEIKLYDDKVEIYFNSPIKINNDKSDCADSTSGFLFYRNFKKMSYTLYGFNKVKKMPILTELYIK